MKYGMVIRYGFCVHAFESLRSSTLNCDNDRDTRVIDERKHGPRTTWQISVSEPERTTLNGTLNGPLSPQITGDGGLRKL